MRQAPPREWAHSDQDARSYQRESNGYLMLIYLVLGLSMAELLPVSMLVLFVPWALSRQFMTAHELMHVRRGDQLDVLSRLYPIFETPLSLGYQELQAIHLAHHRYTATERDPEWFQIRGSMLHSFVQATFAPEHAFIGWVRREGWSASLLLQTVLRTLALAGLTLLNWRVFLIYLLAVRATVAISQFVFHRALHQRAERFGTFKLRLPKFAERLGSLLLGRRNLAIICEHDAHHAWPHVKAVRLAGLLDHYPKDAAAAPQAAERG